MDFSWIELLLGGSFITAITGFITLKSTKRKGEASADSVVIENAKAIMSEYNKMIQNQNEKIDNLEKRVDNTEKRITLYTNAVNFAYRCKLPKDLKECPVLEYVRTGKDCNVECNNKVS